MDVNHKPEEVASCYQIVSDEKYNFDESKIKYRSKKILSEFNSIITLQSFSLLNDYNSKWLCCTNLSLKAYSTI